MIKNLIDFYRIKDWYNYLGIVVLGYLFHKQLNFDIVFLALLASGILAFAFSINEYTDKKTNKKFFLALPFAFCILILPLFNIFQIAITIFSLLLSLIYSLKMFNLKAKIISSLINGFGFALPFFLGFFTIPTLEVSVPFFFLMFFSFNMIAQFIHEHVDCADDKKNKIRNMTQVWGKEFTKKLCYAFLFLAAVSSISLYVLKTINEIFLFSTVVFCIYLTFKFKKIRVIEKKFRKSYKILAMIIGGIYILTKIFF